MTLDRIAWIVGEFVEIDKFSEEFCSLLNFAQGQYFKENVDDEGIIFPFIKHMGKNNNTMPLQVNSIGLAALPADFERHIDFTFTWNGGDEQIERVENWEFSHRLTQAIEIPTRHYPIATYQNSYIKFAPKNLQAVNLTYLSTPPEVVFAYKSENGMIVYDPDNSVELLWTEHDQIEIIKLLLQELGVIVSTDKIKSKTDNQ